MRKSLALIRRRFRMWLLRNFWRCHGLHPTAYICPTVWFAPDLCMKAYSFVNRGCYISAGVTIGRYCMVGPGVKVVGADHVVHLAGTPAIFAGRPALPSTVLEDDCWIGAGAILMAGVQVGRGAIVGAGAVVTHDVPPYEIHAGVPARKIGVRFANDEQRELHDRMLANETVVGTLSGPKQLPYKASGLE